MSVVHLLLTIRKKYAFGLFETVARKCVEEFVQTTAPDDSINNLKLNQLFVLEELILLKNKIHIKNLLFIYFCNNRYLKTCKRKGHLL